MYRKLIDPKLLMEDLGEEPYVWTDTDAEIQEHSDWLRFKEMIERQPTVDAVVMPKGKPGDYLEWDNGTGIKQIYRIYAVSFCEDYVRYDLEKFSPVVDHPNIVRIMSLDEAEKEWREMCAKAVPREEPTLTAVCGERKDK